MPSILITGNKGFIGSGLIGDGFDAKDGVDVVTYRRNKKYDVIIHTAAKVSVTESEQYPKEYIRTNIIGTLNMVNAHPDAHFIYLSTASVYGEGEKHTIKSLIDPLSVYAVTKFAGECIVRSSAKSYAILRLTNVIGSGERGEPNVYQIFEKSDVLPIYGDGLQTRDFIHVEEVRKAIMKCVGKKGIFNVGSGVSKTIQEVAAEFDKPIKFLPPRECEIRHFGIADAFDYSS